VEQRWRVHLALGRLLFQRGDKQRNENLFAEAYAEAQKAIDLAPNNEAEPHFLAGISYYQMSSLAQDLRGGLRYQSRAIHHLDAGLKRDKGNSEANRNRGASRTGAEGFETRDLERLRGGQHYIDIARPYMDILLPDQQSLDRNDHQHHTYSGGLVRRRCAASISHTPEVARLRGRSGARCGQSLIWPDRRSDVRSGPFHVSHGTDGTAAKTGIGPNTTDFRCFRLSGFL
jgi:tetratricopeptide (TPR) repeat protein